jgi:transcription initiation factor IIF auxiliary subunit
MGSWFVLASSAGAAEMSVANSARYLGNRKWEWTIFIQAPPSILDRIRCVEYTLPPTFPTQNAQVCTLGDPRRPFGLTASGWGTFDVPLKVVMKDNAVRTLSHRLRFDPVPFTGLLPIKTDNDAIRLKSGSWSWTVFLRGPENVLGRIQCVEYTLHPTFPNPVREVCVRGTGSRAFQLSAKGWGTFQIPIRIFLKDGQVAELTHDLRLPSP